MSEILKGSAVIKSIIQQIPTSSGVYKMLNDSGEIIYIGKAKNLRNRVLSYANNQLTVKTQLMVTNIVKIDYLVTDNEEQALLLEADLIKHFKPKYNILLKDDKSFLCILLDNSHDYPRISTVRSKNIDVVDNLFGPFASSMYAKEIIKFIQKTFFVRSCTDYVFKARKQPCILYQLKMCSAPCVSKINIVDYNKLVHQAIQYLKGNDETLKQLLNTEIQQCVAQQNYEKAIVLRDQLQALNTLRVNNNFALTTLEYTAFVALVTTESEYFFKVFTFKNHTSYGDMDFIIDIKIEEDVNDVISAFLLQLYNTREVPDIIIINYALAVNVKNNLEKILSHNHHKKVLIKKVRDKYHQNIMDFVIQNINNHLDQLHLEQHKWMHNINELQKLFGISHQINKIEVYDNTHLYGTFPLGVMVAVTHKGFYKADYRIFKIKDSQQCADDYLMFKEVFHRRFSKKNIEKLTTPELIFIDGGIGQLNVVKQVLQELSITDIYLVAIAKGANRNLKEETLYTADGEILNLDKHSNILHFIQKIRDEAHNFARKQLIKSKLKTIKHSVLDNIDGIGKLRKKALLQHFGTIDNIKNATFKQLIEVPSMNAQIAKNIFEYFNS